METKIDFTKEELLLVKERLNKMPDDLEIITLGKSYSKEDLIKQLESGTGLGARIAKRELNYVKHLWVGIDVRATDQQ